MPTNLKILLAEDSPVIQRMISATLSRDGHSVETVGDGSQAVAAAQAGAFDLILMDLRMPVMDGLDAARAIRALDIPQPHIVALSGDHDAETSQACLDAGMNGHLTKPIVPSDMAAVIAEASTG